MSNRTYMTGIELTCANPVTPTDVIASLSGYVTEGGDILPYVYDKAISLCEPPMSDDDLRQVVNLCALGIANNHMPRKPIDYSRPGYPELRARETQANFAALLGAASLRISQV